MELMSRFAPALTAAVIKELNGRGGSVPIAELIDGVARNGHDIDEVARIIRSMLNKGDIGLTPDMSMKLLRELA